MTTCTAAYSTAPLSLLVRSWNVFHGNTSPPRGGERMREMVELITEGAPDVVCLQEVPPWALERLAEGSGMTAAGGIARSPCFGPLPVSVQVGRILNDINRPLARGFFEGQANATLVGPRVRLVESRSLVLNDRRFRRAQTRWLALPAFTRIRSEER